MDDGIETINASYKKGKKTITVNLSEKATNYGFYNSIKEQVATWLGNGDYSGDVTTIEDVLTSGNADAIATLVDNFKDAYSNYQA